MRAAVHLGLIIATIFAVSQLVGSGSWGSALLLGIISILSLVHGLIARNRAKLPWFGYALIVNAMSAVLLALLLVFKDELSLLWLVCVGTGVLVGLLASAWLIQQQGQTTPTIWLEFTRELEGASVIDLLLGRPLTALEDLGRT